MGVTVALNCGVISCLGIIQGILVQKMCSSREFVIVQSFKMIFYKLQLKAWWRSSDSAVQLGGIFVTARRIKRIFTWWTMRRVDLHSTIKGYVSMKDWSFKAIHLSVDFFFLRLDEEIKAHFKMLGVKKKLKQKKRSLGFSGRTSRLASDLDDRVVMLCEDIPSEVSSWDSGRGSNSSGARSSSDDLGKGWRAQSFHGREGRSVTSPSMPRKQYSIREVRHVESSPVYGQSPGHSTLRVRQLYESASTVALCTHCLCLVSPSVLQGCALHIWISGFGNSFCYEIEEWEPEGCKCRWPTFQESQNKTISMLSASFVWSN